VPNAEARKRILPDAIDRNFEITTPLHASQKRERANALAQLVASHIGSVALVSITTATIADTRDHLSKKRSLAGKQRSGSTVNRYVTALSAVLSVTVKKYGWLKRNPVSNVTRLADSKGRERFLSDA
jgi:hypothetical protein